MLEKNERKNKVCLSNITLSNTLKVNYSLRNIKDLTSLYVDENFVILKYPIRNKEKVQKVLSKPLVNLMLEKMKGKTKFVCLTLL